MKITYKFADGTTSTTEVDEEIGAFIMDSRRKEANDDRRHRYHNYSLDAITYEGTEYGECDAYPSEDDSEEVAQRVRDALAQLKEPQRRRLLMLSKGMTEREIAATEGVALFAVQKSIAAARKNFLEFFLI